MSSVSITRAPQALNTGTCWLKSGLTDSMPSNGVISSVRRGWDFWSDYMSGNIAQFNMTMLKPEAYQAYCRNVSTCHTWSIARNKDASGNRNCYIKSAIGTRSLNYMRMRIGSLLHVDGGWPTGVPSPTPERALLPRSETCVLFVGYQAPGTAGRAI